MTRLIRPYDFILDNASGWRPLEADAASVEEGDGPVAGIQLQPLAQRLPDLTDPHGTFGGITMPRGVAVWGDQIFISDPSRHRILHWQPCCGPARVLATIGGLGTEPRQLDTPLGLAISHRDDLVVVDSGNRRLQLFTLPGLALRRILGPFPSRLAAPLPEEPFWHPIDVARGPHGRLYVADRQGLIWRLDAQGRPDPHFDGSLPSGFVPLLIAVDSLGRIYLVSQDPPSILLMDIYGKVMPRPDQLKTAVDHWLSTYALAATFAEEATARSMVLPAELSQMMDVDLNLYLDQALDQAMRQHTECKTREEVREEVWAQIRDAAYETVLPAAYAAHLPQFLARVLTASRLSLRENQILLAAGDPRECYREPLATDLTVDENGFLEIEDGDPGPYLHYVPPPATFSHAGLYRMQPLDSRRLGNPWHRLTLEIDVPERTGIRVFTFTSDVLRPTLATAGLLTEPPQPDPWQANPDNADEFLIQSPPGRYLYLALALKGPGNRTPSVKRIYVHARRQSSLSYLPAAYQADETSRLLLDRLLSLTDTLFGEIESQIEDWPLFLDMAGAPDDFLPWLASWFDLSLEQVWTEAQRRAFLQNIVELYRWRGTIRGMRLMLQLHANLQEPMPQIVEYYRGIGQPDLETWSGRSSTPRSCAQTKCCPEKQALNAEDAMILKNWLGQPPEGDAPHHFGVLLPAFAVDTEEKRAIIVRLIDGNKPAHTHFSIRPVSRGLRLGSTTIRGSALGLDSLLGGHPQWRLPAQSPRFDEDSVLAVSTALPPATAPRSVSVRLGVTRLGEPQLGCRICAPCVVGEESEGEHTP